MTFKNINLMLPTYKRSRTHLPVFLRSSYDTADRPENLLYTILVSVDDTETREYLASISTEMPIQEIVDARPTPDLSVYFNRLYTESSWVDKPDALVSMLGDDMEFLTSGWDTAVLDKMDERDGVCGIYCNDDYLHADVPVNLFLSRKLVEATGQPFMCTGFAHDMIDTIWRDTLQPLGLLEYLDNVVIRHNHSTKIGRDETFNRLRNTTNTVSQERANEYVMTSIKNIVRNL